MLAKRIIPCLDVTGGRVVKGTKFLDLRDAGDPVEAAVEYDRQKADELVFLDITASSDRRDIIYDVVRRTAERIFIPLTVGGGIRTIEDIRQAQLRRVVLSLTGVLFEDLPCGREADRRPHARLRCVYLKCIQQGHQREYHLALRRQRSVVVQRCGSLQEVNGERVSCELPFAHVLLALASQTFDPFCQGHPDRG